MNSRDKFEKLYKLLNGYNRTEYEREIIFDFYNKVGTGVFTLKFNKENNTCVLIDDVEDMTDYKTGERLTLKEYYLNKDRELIES